MDYRAPRIVSRVAGLAIPLVVLLTLLAPGDVGAQQPYYPYPCPLCFRWP